MRLLRFKTIYSKKPKNTMSSAHFYTSFNSQFAYIINWDHLRGALIHCTKRRYWLYCEGLWYITWRLFQRLMRTLNIIAVKTISLFLLLECTFLRSLCLKAYKMHDYFYLHIQGSHWLCHAHWHDTIVQYVYFLLYPLAMSVAWRSRIRVEWTEMPWWRSFIWSLLDVIG